LDEKSAPTAPAQAVILPQPKPRRTGNRGDATGPHTANRTTTDLYGRHSRHPHPSRGRRSSLCRCAPSTACWWTSSSRAWRVHGLRDGRLRLAPVVARAHRPQRVDAGGAGAPVIYTSDHRACALVGAEMLRPGVMAWPTASPDWSGACRRVGHLPRRHRRRSWSPYPATLAALFVGTRSW